MLTSAETSEEKYADENYDDVNNPELSATIYDLLCQHVEGEGLIVLKSNTDCNGFQPWMMLFNKYNPTTFARGLQLLTKVVNPGRIDNYNEGTRRE